MQTLKSDVILSVAKDLARTPALVALRARSFALAGSGGRQRNGPWLGSEERGAGWLVIFGLQFFEGPAGVVGDDRVLVGGEFFQQW